MDFRWVAGGPREKNLYLVLQSDDKVLKTFTCSSIQCSFQSLILFYFPTVFKNYITMDCIFLIFKPCLVYMMLTLDPCYSKCAVWNSGLTSPGSLFRSAESQAWSLWTLRIEKPWWKGQGFWEFICFFIRLLENLVTYISIDFESKNFLLKFRN